MRTPLLGICCLLFGLAAHADTTDTWNVVAGTTVFHDSNLFRATAGQAASEQIDATYAGISVNKPYALQRFTLDARATDFRYKKNSYLDYLGKNVSAAWLWSISPRLHGNLSASYNESLNSFADYSSTVPELRKNIRTVDTYRFDLEWEAWGRLRAVGGINQYNLKNSQLFLAESDYQATAAEYGIKYALPNGSYLTAMGRNTDGKYADGVVNIGALIDSGFKQTDVEGRFLWAITGKSRINGRLAHIDREHDHFAQRNFKGTVGSLDYVLDMGGKFMLNAGFKQDLASYQNAASSYYALRSYSVSPIWQISAKTAIRARWSRDTRDYKGALIPALDGRVDVIRQSLLAVDWLPTNSLTISASVQRDTRDANFAGLDFVSNGAALTASLMF